MNADNSYKYANHHNKSTNNHNYRPYKKSNRETIDIDWDFFRNIPIEEVADLLGIEVYRNNKFICPSHNDTNPSAHMRPKGKNSWCCYTCGAGGSPIDLVMAVEGKNSYAAIKFLNQYFPGGVTKHIEEETIVPPYITPQYLKEIGFVGISPFTQRHVRGIVNIDSNGRLTYEQKTICLSYEEAATLIIDKLIGYIKEKNEYMNNIFSKFPHLDEDSKAYIRLVVGKDIEIAQTTIEMFREFLHELSGICSQEQSPWLMSENDEMDLADSI